MIGKLFGGITAIGVYFCVGTVLAATLLIGMGMRSGKLSKERIDRMIVVLNDSGEKHAATLEAKPNYDDVDIPWEEVAMARALAMRDAELREHALAAQRELLGVERDRIAQERADIDRSAAAMRAQLASAKTDDTSAREENARLILEGMKSPQAKEQIQRMLTNGEEKEVVRLLVAMPNKKRDKIISEFKSENEAAQIQTILKLVREGEDASPNDATATQLR